MPAPEPGPVSVAEPFTAGLVPLLDRPAFADGVRTMLAPGVAIAIWGLVTGVAMVNSGMPVSVALVMTFVAFAGSAQLAVLPLLLARASLPVVWVTALLINLRFVIFSAASRDFFGNLPLRQRLFASWLNGDVGSAIFLRRFGSSEERGTHEQQSYFYGLVIVNWVTWQASSVLGFLLGGLVPNSWGLELAASMALCAVLMPMLTRVPTIAGVVVTAVLSVVTIRMPYRLGLLVSVACGVALAVVCDSIGDRRSVAGTGVVTDAAPT